MLRFDVEFWGRYALFTQPYSKAEPTSYDVMTPSAAKGMLDCIYWHPGMKWIPTRIRVCGINSPGEIGQQKVSITRNETKKISARNNMKQGYTLIDPVTRRCTYLCNVRYIVSATLTLGKEAADRGYDDLKTYAIVADRLRHGSCKERPYFGRRECTASFRMCESIPPCPEGLKGSYPLGRMLWGFDYADPESPVPLFYDPVLTDGAIDIPSFGEVICQEHCRRPFSMPALAY